MRGAIIIVLMLLALALRLWNAGDLSGGDDSTYAEMTRLIIEGEVSPVYQHMPDEPIAFQDAYQIRPFATLWPVLSVSLFGYSAFAMRFPSALFAMLTLPLLYLLIRRFYGERVGLAACLLYTTLPFHLVFSRMGTADAGLIFWLAATVVLAVEGLESNRPHLIYLAGIAALIDMLTVPLRGVLPLAGVVLFVGVILHQSQRRRYERPTKRRLVAHLAASFLIASLLYLAYLTLPLLWGEPGYMATFAESVLHGAGQSYRSNYLPFLESVRTLGSEIFLSPLACLITVPSFFGLALVLRAWRRPVTWLWLGWLGTILVFYLQGQPHINRQDVYVPVLVLFAAIAVVETYDRFADRRAGWWQFPLLWGTTLSFLIGMVRLFPALFPEEFGAARALIAASGLGWLYGVVNENWIFMVMLVLVATAAWIVPILPYGTISLAMRRRVGQAFVGAFLALNVVLALGLVGAKAGQMYRPTEVRDVALHIRDHLGGETYSCVASTHARTFTFYTGRLCANYRNEAVDVAWLAENVAAGKLRYLVVNRFYNDGITPGLGRFTSDGRIDPTVPGTLPWNSNYPDKQGFLLENCADVTALTGLDPTNPYFGLYDCAPGARR
ncbi:glycosyltransferase family 39 protein [Candidatus Woesearchaeota archaeon]|nr:glycosyltransferase family 39 protein [Candidatus Woesearchaeota archaeon]